MENVVATILPVFGIVLIGFAVVRAGLFGEAAIDGVSQFVFNIAIPLLLFRTLARAGLPADIPWRVLLSYYIGAYLVFFAGMALARLAFGRNLAEQGVFGGGASHSNTVLLGIPIVLTVFGDSASVPLFLVIGVHNAVLLPLVAMVIGIGSSRGGALLTSLKDTGADFIRNPLVIGLVGGMLYGRLAPPLAGPVDEMLRLLGVAGAPVALFALGGTLARYRIGRHLGEALATSTLKLAVMPFVVWLLAARVFDLRADWIWVVVLLAAMPSGVNVFIFANRYGAATATAGTTVLVSSLLGLPSLSLLIWLMGA